MQAVVDRFFADFFRLYPVDATEAGNHDHDGEWPDLTDAGKAERLAFLADARASLEAADEGGLAPEEAIDRRVLLTQIDALRFAEEELDELSWSAIAYVYLFGTGLFGLLSREFAAPEVRLASVARRMRGLPAALDDARANLDAPGGRAGEPLPRREGDRHDARRRRPVPHRGRAKGRGSK